MPTGVYSREKRPLTNKQSAVLEFVRKHRSEHGFMPTTREIQAQFGYGSQTAVVNHLIALEKKGFIQRLPKMARGIITKVAA